MVTFNEFRASRRSVIKGDGCDIFEDADLQSKEAYIYGGDHKWGYIELVPYYTLVNGNMVRVIFGLLTLGNEQWVREDIISLERRLYDWGKDDGWFEPTKQERAEQFEQAIDLALTAF